MVYFSNFVLINKMIVCYQAENFGIILDPSLSITYIDTHYILCFSLLRSPKYFSLSHFIAWLFGHHPQYCYSIVFSLSLAMPLSSIIYTTFLTYKNNYVIYLLHIPSPSHCQACFSLILNYHPHFIFVSQTCLRSKLA